MKLVFFTYRDVTEIFGIQSVQLFSNFPFSIIIIHVSLYLTNLKRPDISLRGKVIRIPTVSFILLVVLIISLFVPFNSAKYGTWYLMANWLTWFGRPVEVYSFCKLEPMILIIIL